MIEKLSCFTSTTDGYIVGVNIYIFMTKFNPPSNVKEGIVQ
jgi:hypothetical protein